MTRMGVEIKSSLSKFEGTADEARSSLCDNKKQKHDGRRLTLDKKHDDCRLMSDILWSMTNYLRFHLGDDLVLGSARQYGSYWDIPGGDVKVQITSIQLIGKCIFVKDCLMQSPTPVLDSGWVLFLGGHACFWDNRKDG